MSNLRLSRQVLKAEGSTSIDTIIWDSVNETIEVSYVSNPEFFYTHSGCSIGDMDELEQYIDIHGAGKGYIEWKQVRSDRFQKEDEKQFMALWNRLNEYQRANLYTFVTKKYRSATRLPINKRPDWVAL